MTHAGQHHEQYDRPYDGQHSRRPPTQQQPPPAGGTSAPQAGGISTGRALGMAIALTLTLLAAGTGVLAAAGVLFPVSGQAEGKRAPAAPPALAAQPSTAPPTLPPDAPVPPASRQVGPNGQLVAFGATVQNWNSRHRLDGAVAGGTAYNPDSAVAGNGRLADRYVRVLPLNGRILQYTIQLPRNTSFATATAQALAELPADLRLIWRQQRGACTQASYTSPTLARELTDVGDPKGAVLIEYRSGTTIGAAYDAADVTSATLSALDAPTPANGPLC